MTTKIVSLDDAALYGLPEASAADPFAQVRWIFNLRGSRVPSSSGQANFDYALGFYKRFLQETEGMTPYVLKERWDNLSLLRFRTWLLSQRTGADTKFSSHTLVGVMSAVRQVMVEAAILDLTATQEMINVSMPIASRDTDAQDPYSERELDQILKAIHKELQYTNAVAKGYVRQNTGRDPRVRPEAALRINPRHYSAHGYGWNSEDNLRWYFENEMNCRAISRTDPDGPMHTPFFVAARRYHGGYMDTYRRWGVTPQIDREILCPLVIQLSYLTGLNPSSIVSLRADCLSEHPLTGTPVLRYLKLRSLGEKELLIDLLNDVATPDGDEFESAELPLKREQAILVQRVVEKLLLITRHIREDVACRPKCGTSCL